MMKSSTTIRDLRSIHKQRHSKWTWHWAFRPSRCRKFKISVLEDLHEVCLFQNVPLQNCPHRKQSCGWRRDHEPHLDLQGSISHESGGDPSRQFETSCHWRHTLEEWKIWLPSFIMPMAIYRANARDSPPKNRKEIPLRNKTPCFASQPILS